MATQSTEDCGEHSGIEGDCDAGANETRYDAEDVPERANSVLRMSMDRAVTVVKQCPLPIPKPPAGVCGGTWWAALCCARHSGRERLLAFMFWSHSFCL